MSHLADLRRSLLNRDERGASYRAVLSGAAGVTAEGCILSTAEHIAPFNHLDTVSLLWPLALEAARSRTPPRPVLVLGVSLVPLDNADYPRGFLLPGDDRPPSRVNLWPDRQRKAAPLLLPPVAGRKVSGLDHVMRRYPAIAVPFREPDAFGSYADQLADVMQRMAMGWPPAHAAGLHVHVKPLERVAADVLSALLRCRDPLVTPIFEDAAVRRSLFERLFGVFCAWGERNGSFLLWAVDPVGGSRLLPLGEVDGCLTAPGVKLPLEAACIADALDQRLVFPTVPLSLLAVSWLPGLPVAGGPKQRWYWHHMIEAFNAVLGERRAPTLSCFGYAEFDLHGARAAFGAERIPHYGTGLALLEADLPAVDALDAIEDGPARPARDVRYA